MDALPVLSRAVAEFGLDETLFFAGSDGGSGSAYLGVGHELSLGLEGNCLSVSGASWVVRDVADVLRRRAESGDLTIIAAASLVSEYSRAKHGRAVPVFAVFGFDALDHIIDTVLTSDEVGDYAEGWIVVPAVLVSWDQQVGWQPSVQKVGWSVASEDVARCMQAILRAPATQHGLSSVPRTEFQPSLTQDDYVGMVDIALSAIRSGDVYQVQLGHEVSALQIESPLRIFQRMVAGLKARFYFLSGRRGCAVVGASPESHITVDRQGVIAMRPLAGTVDSRGGHSVAKRHLASSKERAEHLMLVDLCRNDLGRVAEWGTVEVPELFSLVRHPGVFHLASTVTARLREGESCWSALEAAFPAGTVTGAPKLAAIRFIRELERTNRDLYSGSVCLELPDGSFMSALVLRSVLMRGGILSVRASAGIVADSQPVAEWYETIAKMSRTLEVLSQVGQARGESIERTAP